MIGLLNPALGSKNLGDAIIEESIREELSRYDVATVSFSTRRNWTRAESRTASACDLFVVGGTNLLVSDPHKYSQWHLSRRQMAILAERIILLGVGWWQYQGPATLEQQSRLRRLLHPTAAHSVRDSYTSSQLSFFGGRVLNTACPTMWHLSGHSSGSFEGHVITSVTDYAKHRTCDTAMLKCLNARADKLSLWAQGRGDEAYVKSLGFVNIPVIRELRAFRETLEHQNVSYCGTRLHAGIAALQHGRPTLIVAVDNRSTEISRDTGLAIIQRRDIAALTQRLEGTSATRLNLPREAIHTWQSGFRELLPA